MIEPNEFAKRQMAEGAKLLPEPVAKFHRVLCGCGDPPAAWAWLHTYLTALEQGAQKTVEPTSGEGWIACYLVSHLDLSEHGSNLLHPWLTGDGRAVLAFLDEHGHEWSDGREWWIDSEGTTQVLRAE